MNFVVRAATLSDAAAMAAIGAATFALGDSPETPRADLDAYVQSELTAARFSEHLRNPSIAAYLAEADGTPAGYLMLRSDGRAACIAQAKRPLRLWRIYVLPAFHGVGVAAALMETVFEHARVMNCDVMWSAFRNTTRAARRSIASTDSWPSARNSSTWARARTTM